MNNNKTVKEKITHPTDIASLTMKAWGSNPQWYISPNSVPVVDGVHRSMN